VEAEGGFIEFFGSKMENIMLASITIRIANAL
jgi:hypothetical protein